MEAVNSAGEGCLIVLLVVSLWFCVIDLWLATKLISSQKLQPSVPLSPARDCLWTPKGEI